MTEERERERKEKRREERCTYLKLKVFLVSFHFPYYMTAKDDVDDDADDDGDVVNERDGNEEGINPFPLKHCFCLWAVI